MPLRFGRIPSLQKLKADRVLPIGFQFCIVGRMICHDVLANCDHDTMERESRVDYSELDSSSLLSVLSGALLDCPDSVNRFSKACFSREMGYIRMTLFL